MAITARWQGRSWYTCILAAVKLCLVLGLGGFWSILVKITKDLTVCRYRALLVCVCVFPYLTLLPSFRKQSTLNFSLTTPAPKCDKGRGEKLASRRGSTKCGEGTEILGLLRSPTFLFTLGQYNQNSNISPGTNPNPKSFWYQISLSHYLLWRTKMFVRCHAHEKFSFHGSKRFSKNIN